MTHPKNTLSNRSKLAQTVVAAWDMDTLIGFAISALECDYAQSESCFLDDWEDEFGEGDGWEPGVTVYWEDPDDGICSGLAVFVEYLNNEAAIVEKNGVKLEVYVNELSS